MPTDYEEVLLTCMRVVQGPEAVPSDKLTCSECKEEVWRSKRAPQHIRIVCVECTIKMLRSEAAEKQRNGG